MILIFSSIFSGCSSSSGGNEDNSNADSGNPPPLYETFPIDGVIDLSAFDTVNEQPVELRDNFGQGSHVKTTTLRWAMINDDRNIYIALEWTDNTYDHDFDLNLGPQIFDGVKLLFDNDGSGALEDGEDERTIIAASVGSFYIDQHAVPSGDESDLIGDGFAKLSYDSSNNRYQAEFLFPLTRDMAGEDADLTVDTRYNIIIFDHVDLTGPPDASNAGYAYSGDRDASGWPDLILIQTDPHNYPELPTDLTGLIVFISDHEQSKGDIYSFDPSTREVTRITNDATLYKENVSLSHDRTRIAFHGAADKNDVADYEIYTVDIDGANLTRLTNNAILDGHPGWSPDDSRIVYASFRDAGRASIVIMDASGTEILDLTPNGVDDNDPDYLPDGRIIFKTDRFSTSPQLRIAVMNADGTDPEQITFVNDVSDHDPVGDESYTIFERFLKGTYYATDVEFGFTPWDIVEAKLDGSREKTILSDGWVNWLPVYDPSGQYIGYLKNSSGTAAHLMTRDGRELGRFIPNITRLRYFDWK